jgi:succinoglycan biosynthesis transport protein ExoP
MSIPNAAAPSEPPSALRYLGSIGRHWLTVVLIVVLAVGIAIIYSATTPKRYEAQAEVLVNPITGSEDVFAGINVLRDPDTGPLIVGRTLKSPLVTDAVIKQLSLRTTPNKLLNDVDIRPIQQSSVVAIAARAGDPDDAARIANAFALVLIQQRTDAFQTDVRASIDRLRSQLTGAKVTRGEAVAIQERLAQLQALEGGQDPTLSVLSPAVPPEEAIWPRPILSIVVALFAGLLLGVGAVLLIELVEPRIATESELVGRIPVLARIPRGSKAAVRRYLREGGPLPADLWEGYRTLRASLAARGVGEGSPKSVLITSAIQGEGKTMTSTNLAIAMAAAGHRVILIDGDLRRSMIAKVFDISAPSGGFASALQGAPLDDVVISVPGYGEHLRLIVAGDDRPLDLFEPHRITQLLDEVKNDADVIVIDSPPVTEFADAIALADAADIVLITVRIGHSRRDRFEQLLLFLAQHGVTPAGFVVTTRRRARGIGSPPDRPGAVIDQEAGSVPAAERIADWIPSSRK